MKAPKILVSLYILVPLIFGGIALLSAVSAYHLALYHFRGGASGGVFWLVGVFPLLAIVCSYLVLWRILGPITKFVRDMARVTGMPPEAPELSLTATTNPEYYAPVLERATHLLGRIEARELFPDLVGHSAALREVLGQLLKVAPTDQTVLITGESGTGKELIAQAIHDHSPRRGKALVKINCVAIPESLLESELFGHERGAFTGAHQRKQGKFELADGGTVFLDEIGDMPPATQAKLLRVLEEKEIERIGGLKRIPVNVRFLAATNRDLPTLIKEGRFREDLFFRLNAFPLDLPPLRSRREDIPPLAAFFLAGTPAREFSPRAMRLLMAYHWPGNVRELKHCLERAAVMAGEGAIEEVHLPDEVRHHQVSQAFPVNGGNIDERLASFEKEMILEALRQSAGVQARAAQLLGINQRSLWHRVKKFGIDVGGLKK